MFNLEKFINERKIKYLIKKDNKKKIIEYLLSCPNIREALEFLDTKYLHNLDLDFYELPIEGYINLYDYLIQTRNTRIHPKEECYKSRSIYIPILLKEKTSSSFSQYINSDMLLDKMPNNQTVLEYLIENDPFFTISSGFKVDNVEVAKILIEHKQYKLLENSTFNVLMAPVDQNKTVLDILKEQNILPRIRYIKPPKKDNFDISMLPKQDCLLKQINKKTLLDILIEKGFDFSIEINEYIDKPKEWNLIVGILIKHKQLNRIKDAPEKFLTNVITHDDETNKDIKIIDILFEEDLPEITGIVSDKEVLKRYINAGKFTEIIYVVNEKGLLAEIYDKYTILDLLILKFYEFKKSPIDMIKILMMRNLITENITVVLAKYGIYLPSNYKKQTGIKSDADLYHYIYEDDDYEVDEEAKKYLTEFKLHFTEKENSPEILETVIKSFKRTYNQDKETAIRDLKTLILFKKKYPKFSLVYNPAAGNSFTKPLDYGFYQNEPKISLKNKYNLESFHHELGHLVSFILSDSTTPPEIKQIIDEAHKNSLNVIDKIFEEVNQEADEQLLSDEEYENKFIEFIISKYQTVDNYKKIMREEFKKLIGSKDLILEAINDGSYSDEVLKAIVDSYFEIEECEIEKEQLVDMYVETRMNAERKIFKEELYRKTNMEFLCYENFIDAFYGGDLYEYFNAIPKEEKAKVKAPLCTHDKMYYIMQEHGEFAEMYANYVELKKSPKGSFYIEKIKEKTNPRIIELLEEYDKSLTANLQAIKKDKSK